MRQFGKTDTISPVLLELVCTGCLESIFKPLMLVGNGDYPDLEQLQQEVMRHTAPVYVSEEQKTQNLPSGYAFCGMYHAARIWKIWEDPRRYQTEQKEAMP